MQNDVVTVVRDPKHTLGKKFAADGTKSANVFLSFGLAKQVHVRNADAMVKVLKEVADDPYAALINSSFNDVPVGEEFVILSEAQFKQQLNLSTRDDMIGVHEIKYKGQPYKTVGRFKENVKPSSWQLLDRDVDEHTPDEFKSLDHQAWLRKVGLLLPGLSSATQITVPSSSARVMQGRKTLGKTNSHTWVQLADAGDVERMPTALVVKALELGMTWQKPRRSRADGAIVGHATTTILDPSVWTTGRLVFDGKPSVTGTLKVSAFKATVQLGTRLDTSLLTLPSPKQIAMIGQRAGVHLRVRKDSGQRLVIDTADLSFDTALEPQNGSIITVRDALEALPLGDKLRCQTPFRASDSFAAFLSRGGGGKPFVYDSGTNTTHWLNDDNSTEAGYTCFDQEVPTVAELTERLEGMSDAEAREEFAAPTARMPADKQEEMYSYLQKRLGLTKAVFSAALKVARTEAKREASLRAIGKREVIPFVPDAYTTMAQQAETVIAKRTKIEQYHIFAGKPAQLIERELPGTHCVDHSALASPKVYVLDPLDEVAMLAAIEKDVVFQTQAAAGPKNIAVPTKIVEILLKTKEHCAPTISGLLMHPIVLPNGTVVSDVGYHESSRLYIGGTPLTNVRPYGRQEARRALRRIKEVLLEGFQFRGKVDMDMAVVALFTGIVRRVLDQAPGFVFLAPIQSSGKTTLARMIHIILTDRDMPVSSFAEGDEPEMQKRLLAMLLRAPAMVCLDNITDGTTFTSPTLATILTSSIFSQRVLGISGEAECLTNVLFVATGNNLSLGADETTRWLPVHLDAKMARPHERKFKHADVLAHARSIRAAVLRDCIGIISGFMKYGVAMPTATRFARWERMVRQPLCWSGASDPVAAFRSNASKVDSSGAAAALLVQLGALYPGTKFSSSDIAIRFAGGHVASSNQILAEALSTMRARDISSTMSVGRALGSIVDRPVETSAGTLVMRESKLDGLSRYWVESV